jgi:hypothetical protein
VEVAPDLSTVYVHMAVQAGCRKFNEMGRSRASQCVTTRTVTMGELSAEFLYPELLSAHLEHSSMLHSESHNRKQVSSKLVEMDRSSLPIEVEEGLRR